MKKADRSVPAKAAARNTAARPSKPSTDTGGDPQAEQAIQTQDLVASLPFNAAKAAEYAPHDATTAAGRRLRRYAGHRRARCPNERFSEDREGAPLGINATIGTLDRVRADGSGQALTTNQGVRDRRQPELAEGGPARAGAARGLHPAREDHPLRPRAHPRAHRARARLGRARLLRELTSRWRRSRAPRRSPRPASARRSSCASRPSPASAARSTPRATCAASRSSSTPTKATGIWWATTSRCSSSRTR